MIAHPCQSCGACCAFYRVSFHWSETLSESYGVPAVNTEVISPYINAMRGTNQDNPRCESLSGEIGKTVGCDIYSKRPGCCRQFKPSFEDGEWNGECERARVAFGLRALSVADWSNPLIPE